MQGEEELRLQRKFYENNGECSPGPFHTGAFSDQAWVDAGLDYARRGAGEASEAEDDEDATARESGSHSHPRIKKSRANH